MGVNPYSHGTFDWILFFSFYLEPRYHIIEETMDKIRAQVDQCENCQGFFVFRSFGGGTGAGVPLEMRDGIDRGERSIPS